MRRQSDLSATLTLHQTVAFLEELARQMAQPLLQRRRCSPMDTKDTPFLSRMLARLWAFASLLSVAFSSLARKRRSNRHSSPSSH